MISAVTPSVSWSCRRRLGIPAAAVQVLEPLVDVEADLLGGPARRGDEPERHERLPVVDEHHVAEHVVVLEARRAVAVRRVDVVEVASSAAR